MGRGEKGMGTAQAASRGGARLAQHCIPLTPSDKRAWEPGGRAGVAPQELSKTRGLLWLKSFHNWSWPKRWIVENIRRKNGQGPGLGGWGSKTGPWLCSQGAPSVGELVMAWGTPSWREPRGRAGQGRLEGDLRSEDISLEI